jgi:hypothetical protein
VRGNLLRSKKKKIHTEGQRCLYVLAFGLAPPPPATSSELEVGWGGRFELILSGDNVTKRKKIKIQDGATQNRNLHTQRCLDFPLLIFSRLVITGGLFQFGLNCFPSPMHCLYFFKLKIMQNGLYIAVEPK